MTAIQIGFAEKVAQIRHADNTNTAELAATGREVKMNESSNSAR